MKRIKHVEPLPGLMLSIVFDDGRRVFYDVSDDLALPGYDALRDVPGLFDQVQLDQSRTVVYWTDDIDLPSDTLYEYGREWDPDFTKLTPAEAEAVEQAEAEIERGETISHEAINWN